MAICRVTNGHRKVPEQKQPKAEIH